MPNNEHNTDIDSISYPLSLLPITMGPITTLNNIDNLVALPTSTPSSLPLLQTSSAHSFSSSSDTAAKPNMKRRSQVKNACVNCQKACKKCDDGRACQRCIKLGITDTCVDSPRKERKKGFKRGPYKKKIAQLTALKIEEAATTKYTIQINPSSQLHSPATNCAIQPSQLDNTSIAQNRFNRYYNNIRGDGTNILIENNNESTQYAEAHPYALNTTHNELYHASYHHFSNNNNHNTTTKSRYCYTDNSLLYDSFCKPKAATVKPFEAEAYYYANAMQLEQQQQQQQQHYIKNDVNSHLNFTNATHYNDMHANNNTWNFYTDTVL
ncbi:hypothetical protein [Parasitella parasitica]|uniref:Zn(2)-C6 fungal-type domain-containing protein n=1 Tax=Parasitella parasitica TaxID=35722 RepID=A0A0B7N416_9FUNG|nr:hypothetical protein [Parasitella parasitica]